VNTVVLDKTGTLTFGKPEVQAVLPCPGVTAEALLDVAASAELRSEHPLGKTIVAYAQAQGRSPSEPERFGYAPGRGIAAAVAGEIVLVGNQALMTDHGIAVSNDLLAKHREASEIFVARDGRLLGAIAVADTIRPEARQAIDTIHRMGIKTILLTGDAKVVADVVAQQLGIGKTNRDQAAIPLANPLANRRVSGDSKGQLAPHLHSVASQRRGFESLSLRQIPQVGGPLLPHSLQLFRSPLPRSPNPPPWFCLP
jgi:cation transport ATPase